MKKIIVAIDGFSGCGKSSTAKAVAKNLGYAYVDSGAMYRAVTLYFLDNYVSEGNPKAVTKALGDIDIEFRLSAEQPPRNETYLNGLNVEDDIRTMRVSQHVSEVSKLPEVRRFLVAQQQKMGKKKGIVMDGRDIGTVVFPQAELKIFMRAELMERAQRRQAELLANEEVATLDEIAANLRDRDRIDSTRTESPLRQASDAVELDTTYLTFEEQVDVIVRLAYSKILQEDV
ncbi:MAG: (d)CMP kinase [Bernardetiaceae bacterium]|jgi:cytidylate kinase|nr:(d)CMP kinase [Bernardetiaceae bacterium]